MGENPGGFNGFLKPEVIEEVIQIHLKRKKIGTTLLEDLFENLYFFPLKCSKVKLGKIKGRYIDLSSWMRKLKI